MSSIYFFRGKAATGKTLLSDNLSRRKNIAVLRKDDVFDCNSKYIADNSLNNQITYDVLAKLIQTNIDNQVDVVVDVGLSSVSGLNMFLSKIDFSKAKLHFFYCDCSDLEVWRNRLEQRLENPAPNQFFDNVDKIVEYYENSDTEMRQDEILIDSIEDADILIEKILNEII